jgi:hypothetical protein
LKRLRKNGFVPLFQQKPGGEGGRSKNPAGGGRQGAGRKKSKKHFANRSFFQKWHFLEQNPFFYIYLLLLFSN